MGARPQGGSGVVWGLWGAGCIQCLTHSIMSLHQVDKKCNQTLLIQLKVVILGCND